MAFLSGRSYQVKGTTKMDSLIIYKHEQRNISKHCSKALAYFV